MANIELPSWQAFGAASPYDSVVLDGLILGHPWCKARVNTADRELIIGKEKASGSDGGRNKLRGLQLATFSIDLEIWDKRGEDEWEKLCPKVLPLKDPKQRNAVPVYYPTLARLKIDTVVVQSIKETAPSKSDPVLRVSIRCMEEKERHKGGASTKPKTKAAQYAPSIGTAKEVPKTATLADVRSAKAKPSGNIDPR